MGIVYAAAELVRTIESQPTPTSVIIATILGPFVLAYLAYTPNTRLIRVALYPLQLALVFWTVLATNIQNEVIATLFTVLFCMSLTLLCISQWIWTEPPEPPIPLGTSWPAFRATKLFKAINLVTDSVRHVTLRPCAAPLRPTRTYAQSVRYHLTRMVLHAFIMDASTFSSKYLVPFDHTVLGLDKPLGRIFWLFSAGIPAWQGLAAIWHVYAFIMIASGVYVDEEFPKLFNNPALADCMNDLWKRWHLWLAIPFKWWTRPLAFSRPLRILAIFSLSAAYHVPLYYSTTKHLDPLPHFSLFAGSGLVCLVERTFYKTTGRRVGGIWGRIWLICCLAAVGSVWAKNEWTHGWAKYIRLKARAQPETGPLNWLLYGLGVVKTPPTEWQFDP